MILNVERFEHLPGVGESDGFRVSVHPVGSNPFPEIQGFSIPTGMEVLVATNEAGSKTRTPSTFILSRVLEETRETRTSLRRL